MDPPTIQKDEHNLGIDSTSKLHSSLAVVSSGTVMTGNLYTSTPCRVFSNVVTSYHLKNDLLKCKPQSPTEETQRNYQKCDFQATSSESKRELMPSIDTAHDIYAKQSGQERRNSRNKEESDKQSTVMARETTLTGYLNGYIFNASHCGSSTKSPGHNSYCIDHNVRELKSCENMNENNNRMVPDKSPDPTYVSPKQHVFQKLGKSEEYHFESHSDGNVEQPRATKLYREKKHNNINVTDDTLNGSDILQKMYATFGSDAATISRLHCKANIKNKYTPDSHLESCNPTFNKSFRRDENFQCTKCDDKIHRTREESQKKQSDRINYNENCRLHPSIELVQPKSVLCNCSCNIDLPKTISSEQMDLPGEEIIDRQSQNNDSINRYNIKNSTRISSKNSPNMHAKSSSKLSSHIHSLGGPAETTGVCRGNSYKISKTKYPLCPRRDEVTDARCENRFHRKQTNIVMNSRRYSSDKNCESKRRTIDSNYEAERDAKFGPNRTRGSSTEKDYNENARDIFRHDKEIIENSLRQNKRLAYDSHSNDFSFHSPYWLNASTLAAFQASLLSSFPQNFPGSMSDHNTLLRSSFSAASAGNPFALDVNACVLNPYFYRGLPGSEVGAAAYHNAVVHEILRNQATLNPMLAPAIGGNISGYPNPSAFMYGGVPFPETSPIAAAIAASMRQSNSSLYKEIPSQYPHRSCKLDDKEPCLRGNIASKTDRNISSPPPFRERRLFDSTVCKSETKKLRINFETNDENGKISKQSSINQGFANNDGILTSRQCDLEASSRATSPTMSKLSLKRKSPPVENPPVTIKRTRTKMDTSYQKPTVNEFLPINLLPSKNEDEDKTQLEKLPLVTNTVEKCPSSRPPTYKNLTRERRLVANARERTRVHTISSAFEDLRQQIPSYSCNQKLSKLAILRIACSYIQSLSVLAGRSSGGTFKESVDQCTRVLQFNATQAESRARSRRKSNKAQIEWEVTNYETAPSDKDNNPYANPCHSRRSHGASVTIAHHVTAAKSLSREYTAQVDDEKPNRKNDESHSQSHREFSGDSYSFNITRSDESNDSCNESNENATADNVSTADDSLNACSEQINGSPKSDTDHSTWPSPLHCPSGDSSATTNTWRDNIRTASATFTCPIFRNTNTKHINDCDSDCEMQSHVKHVDQQNDVINVED
ncbi:uncharacterized protein LOC120344270 isoform X1 [Styela clava]